MRPSSDLVDGEPDPGEWVDVGGSRRWKPQNMSSPSRGCGKLGQAPVRFLLEQAICKIIGMAAARGRHNVIRKIDFHLPSPRMIT